MSVNKILCKTNCFVDIIQRRFSSHVLSAGCSFPAFSYLHRMHRKRAVISLKGLSIHCIAFMPSFLRERGRTDRLQKHIPKPNSFETCCSKSFAISIVSTAANLHSISLYHFRFPIFYSSVVTCLEVRAHIFLGIYACLYQKHNNNNRSLA